MKLAPFINKINPKMINAVLSSSSKFKYYMFAHQVSISIFVENNNYKKFYQNIVIILILEFERKQS